MKRKWTTILLLIGLLIGISLLLYPTVSDWWNSFHQTRAIASYSEKVADADDGALQKVWEEAEEYNRTLLSRTNRYRLSKEEQKEYESLLNFFGNGIMGYIEIPSIKCSLPVYHGIDDTILQIAIGHIAGSSIPVGGVGTHSVLSGHRGLPSATLFTNLDKLAEGDIFILQILDQTLTYEVDQIHIVEPDDVSDLAISPDQDLCTLVTCTPYGVNSHRLLVRGHRIENLDDGIARVTADAIQIDPILVAPAVATPILITLLILMLVNTRKKGGKQK